MRSESGKMGAIERDLFQQGFRYIAGTDEAGRGPLAGPVVAAAVIFEKGITPEGVADSKTLSPRKREELAKRIRDLAIDVRIAIVSAAVIDEINILQASVKAMKEAVEALTPRPDHVIADGISFHHEKIPYLNVVRGDALCVSIAAASIIAKVTRDAIMTEYGKLFPEYGFEIHKGYPTKAHREAVLRNGISPIHRRSFRILQPSRQTIA